jgi:hypothetical protein
LPEAVEVKGDKKGCRVHIPMKPFGDSGKNRPLNPNPHFMYFLVFLMVNFLCAIFASSFSCEMVKLDAFIGF